MMDELEGAFSAEKYGSVDRLKAREHDRREGAVGRRERENSRSRSIPDDRTDARATKWAARLPNCLPMS